MPVSQQGDCQAKHGTVLTLGTPQQAPGAMYVQGKPCTALQVHGTMAGQQSRGWQTQSACWEAAEGSSSTWLGLSVLLAKA